KATFEQYPRRQQLMRKYANVSTDWKKELADYSNYLKANPTPAVQPEPVKQTKVDLKKINAWGFDAEQARQKQLSSNSETEKVVEIMPGVNMHFTWIPEGSFMMGKDKGGKQAVDHKKVNIGKGFWMGTLEVTNEQVRSLMPEHDSRFIGQQWKDHTTPGYTANDANQPAIRVTWEKAKEYCKLLSDKTGLNIKLPTEEQWEWACRAGSTGDMWYGDQSSVYSEYENLADFTIKDLAVWGLEPTVPMPDNFFCRQFWDYVPRDKESNDKNLISSKGGQYKANPWGLYDMHGNVAEWTDSDSKEASFSNHKIVRGGSWRDRSSKATAYSRRYYKPWQAPYNVGFRVVID
ncbi:MAG: formylglycine-generating enzyme family protein, partial [Bacteroidales bacterium]